MNMTTKERASKAAKAQHVKWDKIRLEEYLKNPNLCKKCGKEILPRENEKLHETKRRKFCDRSCSASHTNSTRKYKGMERTSNRKCEECGSLLVRREKTETNYAFQHRRFCNRKCSCDSRCGWISGNPTKEHIFNNGKNWQSSRSSIRQNAEKVIKLSGRPMICKKCGYTNHVEICHIKSVSSFDKLSSLNEINSLDNLVLLCSNHHWEFDHGLLIL